MISQSKTKSISLEKVTNAIKEIRLLIAFIIAAGGTSFFNWELVMDYVYTYNAHIILGNIFIFYIHHFLSNKRHKKTEIELKKSQIKEEINRAYRDYKDVEVIDFESSIKYIYDLNERKKELGVNSYTDEMMKVLLDKIQIK